MHDEFVLRKEVRHSFWLRWVPEEIAGAYALSVVSLAELTSEGVLGDHLYGHLLMGFMALPFSIAEAATGLAMESLTPQVLTSGTAEWASLLWPGLLQALLLWWLLRRGRHSARSERWGRLLATLTTFLVIVSGMVVIFDQWAPRRPGGIPLLVLGVLQAFFVFVYAYNRSFALPLSKTES
ncbi:hypothetical protein ACFQVD_16400 [Streptosporangium amethystogenes subsp. fukuiense]|uniref:Uncharacterized protein n=1 Tax=Streptosporangium amethystogenes subsp. fukuiense TaxID=698418 RepID=A0ABW2SZE6_9ACTN